MPSIPDGHNLSTWKQILDLQLRLRNPRLEEEEQDRLHRELRDALTRFRATYVEEAVRRRAPSTSEPNTSQGGADSRGDSPSA